MRIRQFDDYVLGNWSIIKALVENNSFQGDIFYAVPKNFENMVCRTNVDAFLIAVVQIAAFLNEDIFIEDRPISEMLKNNLEHKLLPAFLKMKCGNSQIRIFTSTTTETAGGKSGATGISLGVDCFYTVLTEPADCFSYCLSITDCDNPDKLPDDIAQIDENFKTRQRVVQKLGKQLIPVLTNVRSLSWKMAHLAFEQVHTFAHLSAPMVLMNGIRTYYYSTGYPDSSRRLDFADTSHYDYLISEVLDYPSFKMYTSGGDKTRIEKTEIIAFDPIVMESLDVCFHNSKFSCNCEFVNCTRCSKCLRTASALELLGVLDKYSAVFDIDLYYRNRARNWGDMRYRALIMKDIFSQEVLCLANKCSYKIPCLSWLFFLGEGISNQIKKIKRVFCKGNTE